MVSKIQLIYIILACSLVVCDAIFCTGECKESGIRCADPYSYQICVNMTDYAVAATETKTCPNGTICTNQGLFPCKVGTVPVPTTTPAPTTLPPCSGPAKFPTTFACNVYYECVQVLWWWEPQQKTCLEGENFNPSTNECVSSNVYKCGNVVATTAIPETPKCSGAGLLPGPTANQYYECQLIWFQWQPQLKTCPDGQVFDKSASKCANVAKVFTLIKPDQVPSLEDIFSKGFTLPKVPSVEDVFSTLHHIFN